MGDALNELVDRLCAKRKERDDFLYKNGAVIGKLALMDATIEELTERVKTEARKHSVLGEHWAVFEDHRVVVSVTGRKSWSWSKAVQLLPQKLLRLLKKVEISVDTKTAQAMLDSGKISQETAKLLWEPETPAVKIEFKE